MAQQLTLIRLMGHLSPIGLAWLPVGLVGFDDEGHVFQDYMPDDTQAASWRQRVEAGLAAGTPPAELAALWSDASNEITWGVETQVIELGPDESAADRFRAEADAVLGEYAALLAEAEAVTRAAGHPVNAPLAEAGAKER